MKVIYLILTFAFVTSCNSEKFNGKCFLDPTDKSGFLVIKHIEDDIYLVKWSQTGDIRNLTNLSQLVDSKNYLEMSCDQFHFPKT